MRLVLIDTARNVRSVLAEPVSAKTATVETVRETGQILAIETVRAAWTLAVFHLGEKKARKLFKKAARESDD